MKTKKLFRNFAYTISSNLISMLISSLVILVVPKLIGVKEYGYWQLYIFYTGYVGMFHMGWTDGIYLRFGGAQYEDLDKPKFFSQFVMLFVSQFILMLGVLGYSFTVSNPEKMFIWQMTAVCMLIVNMRQMLYIILQDTNQIQAFASATIFDRVMYIVLILALLFGGIREYKLLIIADLIGKLASFFYSSYYCKEIVYRKFKEFKWDFKEAWLNIDVGIKLLFANFASILIIGIIRMSIEQTWGVATFGKVSLTLTISNLLMVFINAIGIVLFPMLKRTSEEKLAEIYENVRIVLMTLLFLGIILYFPASLLLPAWLPEYKEGLVYMAILFPMCIYEGKFSLLVSTYMKTLRMEKSILLFNLLSLAISAILSVLNVMTIKNLNLLMFTIIIVLGFRSTASEIYLAKKMRFSITKNILLETLMVGIFIISAWFLPTIYAFVIYLMTYLLFILIEKNKLHSAWLFFKKPVSE